MGAKIGCGADDVPVSSEEMHPAATKGARKQQAVTNWRMVTGSGSVGGWGLLFIPRHDLDAGARANPVGTDLD